MKNQVDALRGYGVKVHMLSSESSMEERQAVSPLSGQRVAETLRTLTFLVDRKRPRVRASSSTSPVSHARSLVFAAFLEQFEESCDAEGIAAFGDR